MQSFPVATQEKNWKLLYIFDSKNQPKAKRKNILPLKKHVEGVEDIEYFYLS